MADTLSFKRLILRAVLRQVSPMIIRLVSVSDHLQLPEFHDIFRAILGWDGDLGYIIASMVRSSTASAGRRDRKLCMNSNCTGRKSSSTSATRCICGNGMFESSIFRTVSKATTSLCVWAAAALRPRSFAAVRPVTGS